MTLQEAIDWLQPKPGRNQLLSDETIGIVCEAARKLEIATAEAQAAIGAKCRAEAALAASRERELELREALEVFAALPIGPEPFGEDDRYAVIVCPTADDADSLRSRQIVICRDDIRRARSVLAEAGRSP